MSAEQLPDFKFILNEQSLKQDLIQTIKTLDDWIKYRDEHIQLLKHLENLNKELSQRIMVPITSKALIRGSLVHTNELLVNLGGSWFAKRSAIQTQDICKRRIQSATEMIELYEKQYKLINDRIEFSNVNKPNDLVEIIEPYDEEAEKKWREQHKINVRKEKQKK